MNSGGAAATSHRFSPPLSNIRFLLRITRHIPPIILFIHSSSVFYGKPACCSENRHWRSVGVGQWVEGPARPRISVHSQHISPQQNAAALTFCRLSYQSDLLFPHALFVSLQLSFLNSLIAGAVWRIAHRCSYLIREGFCLWSF
jgi:hypothetical protein